MLQNGKVNEYWMEAEDTGKSVDDAHTETAAESKAAAVRGKGTSVRMGVPGWDKVPNLFFLIQIPGKQERATHRPWTSCPVEMDEEPPPTYRSLIASTDDAPPTYRSCGAVTTARLSRGEHAGEYEGIKTKNFQRADEPITITATMVYFVEGGKLPDVDDVKKVANKISEMYKIAGGAKQLFDKEAKLTTDGAPTDATMDQIAKKPKTCPAPPRAPVVGIVVEA